MHAVRVAVVTASHLVTLLGPAAGEDPAAGRGAAVVLELAKARQLLAGLEHCASRVSDVGHRPAVHFLGQFLRGWLFRDLVWPVDVHQRVRVGAALGLVALAQAQEQLAHDVNVGAGLARAVGALPVPLQPAAAVDQRAVFLGEAGGGQADHFGLDVGRIDIVERPGVAPELRGLGGQRVHDHQPLELAKGRGDAVLVRQRGYRVETLAHVAVDLALAHHLEHAQHVVGRHIELGQPVVAPVVLRRGVGAVPGLHQADMELAVVLPVRQLPRAQRFGGALVDERGVVLLGIAGQGQVARQRIGKQAEVGQALDVGVPAQGVDPATRHADVTQQQLHHGRTADDLCADRVLRPAKRIEDRHGLARYRAGSDLFPDLQHGVLRHATGHARQFRGIAAVVLLHQLEHAARVLQGRVDLGKTVLTQLVTPAGLVGIHALGLVVTAEQAILEAIVLFDDERHVGVVAHVLVLDLVLGQQVVDQPAHEGDVGAGTDRRVIVGHRGGAGKTRIDHDQPRLVVRLGFGHPFEAARVRFCCVAAHHQNQIRVGDIGPVVGHGTTAVRRGKTCHRRAMSDTCLVIEPQHACCADDLVGQVASLAGGGGSSEKTGGEPAVDRLPLGVLFDEVGVAVLLHQAGDAIERLVPADPHPLIAARLAYLGVLQAARAVDEVQQAGAFRAEGAAVDRVVGVTFDMDDVLFDVLARIALAVHDQAAADRAVGTGVTGFFGMRQLEVTHLLGECWCRGHAQRRKARASKADGGDLEELPTVQVHRALLIRWWTHGTWPAPLGSHGGGQLMAANS
ncbi:hypothetical protein D3C72_878710 [compost metagenome]